MDDLIAWLIVPLTLGGVLLGWWIQEQINAARFCRDIRHHYAPIANLAPPTTLTLNRPTWMEDGNDG